MEGFTEVAESETKRERGKKFVAQALKRVQEERDRDEGKTSEVVKEVAQNERRAHFDRMLALVPEELLEFVRPFDEHGWRHVVFEFPDGVEVCGAPSSNWQADGWMFYGGSDPEEYDFVSYPDIDRAIEWAIKAKKQREARKVEYDRKQLISKAKSELCKDLSLRIEQYIARCGGKEDGHALIAVSLLGVMDSIERLAAQNAILIERESRA